MAKVNKPTSKFAIGSLIFGVLSFIPIVGLLFVIIAIIAGGIALWQIEHGKAKGTKIANIGIVLGFLGIAFTIWFITQIPAAMDRYADENRFKDKDRIIRFLQHNQGQLDWYYKNNGRYPDSLEQANKMPQYDFYLGLSPHDWFYYKVSEDGQKYDLRSLGPDGKYNTQDDIIAPH